MYPCPHRERYRGDNGRAMKRTILTAVRGMLVSVCVLLLAVVLGYRAETGGNVAMFILGVAAGWILLEKALMAALGKNKAGKG